VSSRFVRLCVLEKRFVTSGLYDWRREFRSVAAVAAGLPGSDFVPVVAESPGGSGAAAIEIEIGSAIVRVGAGVELALLGKVLRLLKAIAVAARNDERSDAQSRAVSGAD
jgi:hypothetical protein